MNRLKQFVILRESGETILSPRAKMDGPLSRTKTEGGERYSKLTGFALEAPLLGFGHDEIAEHGDALGVFELFRINKVSIEFRCLHRNVDLHQA